MFELSEYVNGFFRYQPDQFEPCRGGFSYTSHSLKTDILVGVDKLTVKKLVRQVGDLDVKIEKNFKFLGDRIDELVNRDYNTNFKFSIDQMYSCTFSYLQTEQVEVVAGESTNVIYLGFDHAVSVERWCIPGPRKVAVFLRTFDLLTRHNTTFQSSQVTPDRIEGAISKAMVYFSEDKRKMRSHQH